jgi:hypothetical protein
MECLLTAKAPERTSIGKTKSEMDSCEVSYDGHSMRCYEVQDSLAFFPYCIIPYCQSVESCRLALELRRHSLRHSS